MKIIIIFALATLINVLLSTIRSITTIKSNKWIAGLVNAISYGFYTWLVVLTVADFNLWIKVGVTAIANFIGVWIIKFIEEKARKDKLWLVKITIPKVNAEKAKYWLKTWEMPYSYVDIEKYVVFDTYCATQKDTELAVKVCDMFNGKKFATESKI